MTAHSSNTAPDTRTNMDIKNRNDWIVIGISGVTCGGKTTLANNLLTHLSKVFVFHQDKYFYPDDSPKHVRCDGLEHNNYDVLSSLDMEAMQRDVLATLAGADRSQASCSDDTGRWAVAGKKFLVLEGFTVLNYKPLFDLCDLRYYFVLEYAECFARRALRLYEPPDVAGYFERCVWPQHLNYRKEIEKQPDVHLIDGTRGDALRAVLADLRRRGATELT